MNNTTQFEHRASSSRSMHVGESSKNLCDRLSRTRDSSQRQLPTDHDYATSTREYQTDQSSLKSAPTAAGSVLDKRQKQRQQPKQPTVLQQLTGSLHMRFSRTRSRRQREHRAIRTGRSLSRLIIRPRLHPSTGQTQHTMHLPDLATDRI